MTSMKQTLRIHHHHGYTLVEVMVVIMIIMILAGLSIGGLQFVNARRDNNKAEIQINLLSRGIEEYKLDNGDYPGDENAGGLDGSTQTNMLFKALYYDGLLAGDDGTASIYLADLDPENDSQKWIEGSGASSKIIDPWKAEFRYRRGSDALNPDYDLWSMGKDGLTAGNGADDKDKDDIANF